MAGRKRHDPVSRPADGRRPYDRILNMDPGRHYVLTNPNDRETGTDYYVGVKGYEVEHQRQGGPRAAIGRTFKEGDEVTVLGQVLVSCPLDQKAEEDAQGEAIARALDRRMLKDGNVDDGFRGRGVAYGVDRAETSTLEELQKGA
jgi:hypothetical protein